MREIQVPDFSGTEKYIRWAEREIASYRTIFSESSKQDLTLVTRFNETTGITITSIQLSGSEGWDDIERHAVNALQHLRNSFDQAVNTAVGYRQGKRYKGNFPWSRDLKDLQNYRIQALPDEFKDAIFVQEPYYDGEGYPGGNSLVRGLAELCNQKHSVGVRADINGLPQYQTDPEIVGGGEIRRITFLNRNWDPVRKKIDICAIEATERCYPKLGGQLKIGVSVSFDVPTSDRENELKAPREVDFALNEFLKASKRNLELMKSVAKLR